MLKNYTEEDEIALKELLLDEVCLEQLLPWTGKVNIFDVLKISKVEIRHSNMLSWLLDANENHGLGDKFIKALFRMIVNNNSKHNVFDMLLLDYYSFVIFREWKNIDILLISKKEKVLVAIENKVGSHEHNNQLDRYRTILDKEYGDYKKIFLFLTPDGEEPSDSENWEVITYQELVDELEMIIQNVELLPDAEFQHIRTCVERLKRLEEEREKIYQSPKKDYMTIEAYNQNIEYCKKEIERAMDFVEKNYLWKLEDAERKVIKRFYFYGDDWPEAVSRGAAEKIEESILDDDEKFKSCYEKWKKRINRHLKKVTYVPEGHM